MSPRVEELTIRAVGMKRQTECKEKKKIKILKKMLILQWKSKLEFFFGKPMKRELKLAKQMWY